VLKEALTMTKRVARKLSAMQLRLKAKEARRGNKKRAECPQELRVEQARVEIIVPSCQSPEVRPAPGVDFGEPRTQLPSFRLAT
jgi:hypothetical protein